MRRFGRAVFRPDRWFAGKAARRTLAILARMPERGAIASGKPPTP